MGTIRLFRGGLYLGVALGALVAANGARADSFDIGDPNWAVRWDNTFKYSNAFRVAPQDGTVAAIQEPSNSNTVQGDRNFKQGLISNRVDLLSELDAIYKEDQGFRLSAAAWYDSVYNQKTDNTDIQATNNAREGANQLPGMTQVLHGRDAEILDALVFKKFQFGEQSLSVRAGRFSQLYGETLFMGANGIAAAQGPVDVIKALSVPNSQFKEIMLPVGQVAVNYQPGNGLTFGVYYQFQYRPDRLPGNGSYFSDASIFGEGLETIFPPFNLPGNPIGQNVYLHHTKDMRPNEQGQAGGQIRWKASENWEFGLYAANYHEKDPAADYVIPTAGAPALRIFPDGASGLDVGYYQQVFNKNVQTYGASFATAIGDTNVSGEISGRHNQSLVTNDGAVLVLTGPAAASDNSSNTAYLRGDTLHANVSAISLLTENAIWDGAAVVAELGANHLMAIDNKGGGRFLNPTSTHTAAAARAVLEPSFFQVIPNLDITTPIGFGAGLYGRSALGSHIGNFNPASVYDLSIGVKGSYKSVWKVSLTYTNYFGAKGQPTTGVARDLSYAQDLYDRDFVAFSVSRTF